MTALLRPGLWATAAVLMLAACDASSPNPAPTGSTPSADPPGITVSAQPSPTCPDEEITFGTERRHHVVTHVASAQVLARNGGVLDAPLRSVRPYAAEVSADGAVPEFRVYRDFAARRDPSEPAVPPLGEVFTPPEDTTTMQGPGRIVHYAGVQALEAPFSYRCGSVTAHGVVRSWAIPVSGVLDCTTPRRYQGNRMAEEAARIGCDVRAD
ncbi:hypothetical protein [Spirilliplanes yamanashiensis]|uniref:Lipoprotein n=1 Tax=Spirilliplanes yamanashiensis TaxID=42233 RepID=A0A8J3YA42_9ACTN|nr:hypothetical protein [Spirilliplanes yamanashiensis]MDP9815827.1 hypothetical protein [Spirilliplanes yamanashiensis]GIJ04082.1 hypothetical protein Sya03_34340 [Spirilliplanes yamanashiensis]